MKPEWIVLIAALVGVVISGFLLIDAIQDRHAVKKVEEEEGQEPFLTSFTRARGIAETIRFAILVMWVYVAGAVITGNDRLREVGMWVLVSIPVLITISSIHSWWEKTKREGGREDMDKQQVERGHGHGT